MTAEKFDPVAPGSTIGLIGGGQLGRMTALAAAELGYRCHVYSDTADSPAAQVCAAATVAPYDDIAAMERFAGAVDVVTFEFENIPHESVRRVAELVAVRPGWNCLQISQDRVLEKRFINDKGVATASFEAVESLESLEAALSRIGRPAVLKTTRLGYDGKGQTRIDDNTDLAAAWSSLGSTAGIVEAFIPFEREISVIVARGVDGQTAAYVAVENRHKNHILDMTIAPAPLASELADQARALARTLAEKMDLVGLLAVEMFVTQDGSLLVNELAPRPHNSGHWTLDACAVSQFEQLVRAVCGLPLGAPRRHSNAVMTNLLGEDAEGWLAVLREPEARLHLYGKAPAKPGRKMGHVTRLSEKT